MSKFNLLASALIAICSSSSSFASLGADQVDGVDRGREGDLAVKAAAFYDQSAGAVKCADGNELGKTIAFKMESDSVNEEKKPDTSTEYNATYLVLKQCLYGSTFMGAYKEVRDATIIKARRYGKGGQSGGKIKPTEADQFTVIRKVSLSDLTSPQQ